MRILVATHGIYLTLAAAPLAVAAIGHDRLGRGFWIEFAVALGFVGFAMLTLQFALTAKFRRLSMVLGLDALLHLHRQIGIASYGFVLAHVAILVTVDANYRAFLDFRVDPARALALWTVLAALTALLATTLRRVLFGIPYE